MLPIDSVTKAPWSSDNANLKLHEIKRQVTRDLRRRDQHNSGGALCEATGYKTTMEVGGEETTDESGVVRKTQGRLVADPRLVGVKHSGVDTKRLTSSRYQAFCAEPKNEKEETAHLVEAQRETSIGVAVAAAKDLEDELAEIPEPPVRRKPGRPKGTRNKPRDDG